MTVQCFFLILHSLYWNTICIYSRIAVGYPCLIRTVIYNIEGILFPRTTQEIVPFTCTTSNYRSHICSRKAFRFSTKRKFFQFLHFRCHQVKQLHCLFCRLRFCSQWRSASAIDITRDIYFHLVGIFKNHKASCHHVCHYPFIGWYNLFFKHVETGSSVLYTGLYLTVPSLHACEFEI